ncbi:unnamed protein product [Effrenium voratum]|uniref:RNase NYN domain-containing protein n=1 Tax=Effrenium voratum TaxID=2562239 RepID=A0AA36MPT0_9DINO|nr:unnamed protein product [Effrenium voratum]
MDEFDHEFVLNLEDKEERKRFAATLAAVQRGLEVGVPQEPAVAAPGTVFQVKEPAVAAPGTVFQVKDPAVAAPACPASEGKPSKPVAAARPGFQAQAHIILDSRNITSEGFERGGAHGGLPHCEQLLQAYDFFASRQPEETVWLVMHRWVANRFDRELSNLQQRLVITPQGIQTDDFMLELVERKLSDGHEAWLVSNNPFRHYLRSGTITQEWIDNYCLRYTFAGDCFLCPHYRPVLPQRALKWPRAKPRFAMRSRAPVHYTPKKDGAYVSVLWALEESEEMDAYGLDALVLGSSLLKHGGTYDRVLLVTEAVFWSIWAHRLQPFWDMRVVHPLDVSPELVSGCHRRFHGVFTKLRVFELEEYRKVVLLDLDLLVRSNCEELFSFQAPTALQRGNGEWDLGRPRWAHSFLDRDSLRQKGGVNVGVVILEPSLQTFQQMQEKLLMPDRRFREATTMPEQDFLTLWFVGSWRPLHVKYNYQLHHLKFLERDGHSGPRARLPPQDVVIWHFSAKPKPSSLFADRGNGHWVEEYAHLVLPDCDGHERSIIKMAAREWLEALQDASPEDFGPAFLPPVLAICDGNVHDEGRAWTTPMPAKAKAKAPPVRRNKKKKNKKTAEDWRGSSAVLGVQQRPIGVAVPAQTQLLATPKAARAQLQARPKAAHAQLQARPKAARAQLQAKPKPTAAPEPRTLKLTPKPPPGPPPAHILAAPFRPVRKLAGRPAPY